MVQLASVFVWLPERFDFGSLADGRLLQDQLLKLCGGGDEPDITVFADLPADPPVVVVLLVYVQEVPNLEAEMNVQLGESINNH